MNVKRSNQGFFIAALSKVSSIFDGLAAAIFVVDGDRIVNLRSVDVHVGRLRKALSNNHQPDPIRTVRGTGFFGK